jgi:carboxypeptidase Taq
MAIFSKATVLSLILSLGRRNSSSTNAFSTMRTRSTTFGGKPAASAFLTRSLPRGGGAAALSSTTTTTTDNESTTTTTSTAYQQVVAKLERITHLSRAQAVLGYDQQVFMPSSAAAERGAQMAALATIVHEQQTDPQLLELMEQALKQDDLPTDAKRLLELEVQAFLKNQRVPSALAAKAAALQSSAYAEWVTAKNAKDFASFAPTLQDCFDTAMAIAEAKMDPTVASTKTIYDEMLDEFEMGMSQDRIDDIFKEVQTALVPLIATVLASPTPPSTAPLQGHFDIEKQQKLSEQLVKAIGFDPTQGRIDVSVHPFTSSMSAADVRITSRFREDEWYQGLAGTIHEGGHAIYEQSLPKSALSLDTALSMGTHESQSLFWERHVGLSKAFWTYATPLVKDSLGEDFDQNTTPEEVYGAVNAVSPSLIRVEADELTYPLHVILRYNMERDVIAGKLKVDDIPKRWKDDMIAYLNVDDVPSDDKGCLQDVHWSALAFGYFPTYLIGAIAAAQLFHYCGNDIKGMESKMEQGEFGEIKDWLTQTVHQHGRRYPSLDALLQDQLGEPLNPQYFVEYLTNKYTDLYQL